ncbi:hypothetical protein BOTBODRAFT_35254 [Botryobasidium botryosum FD-172 SS1]|uniref:Uncharacterized protein n=1 Tax=Botryobasidium botryosum (strain FD-172 SS1) TaxID=930990 RepID=A0A067M7N9_BOTB1|nr:hypothetical protein BOTBODRAFT_35254 [Botryobasidium botryosum FD-172 SS1]
MAAQEFFPLNDTIYPSGPPLAPLTPRETHTRNATIILTFGGPIVAAVISLLSANRWWTYRRLWSFSSVSALWFVTIAVWNMTLYVKGGETDRTALIVAGIYGQVEALISCLLLDLPAPASFALVWLWGMIEFGLVMLLSNIKDAYVATSSLVMTNALVVACLFFYGKQAGYCLAMITRILGILNIFTGMVYNIGVIPYNAINFFTLGFQIALIIGGILNSNVIHLDPEQGPIEEQQILHPLQTTAVPLSAFLGFFVCSLAASIVVSLSLANEAIY